MKLFHTITKKKNTHHGLGDIYRPASKGNSLKVDTPDSMTYEIHESLRRLERSVGSVDKYVQEKMGYRNTDELQKSLSAEQIDAVGLAVWNIEAKNEAIIIGDQTGIGKGRIAAAMIRYGIVQGHTPIFITEKPNLFSDLYRDLKAIGAEKYRPYIVNAKESKSLVKDEDGMVVFEPLDAQTQAKIINSGKLPRTYQYVMLTYSQISDAETDAKGNFKGVSPKLQFIRNLAEGNTMVLDESHNASGNSNTGKSLQDIVSRTAGVTFLSATFAKRPDNMPLYAMKTSMREANLTPEQLQEAIKKGGVALQEVLSSQLVSQGQMIRRERSFQGIEVNYITTDELATEQRGIADSITQIMRDIIEFQEKYITPTIWAMDKIASARGKEVKERDGTKKAGIDNSPYFSKVFQAINQMLFAIKADAVADRAIMRLKQGKKPVIAFASTMGSFIESLTDANGHGVGEGDRIQADFATVLIRGLEGVLRYTEVDLDGKTTSKMLDLQEFSEEAQSFYRNTMNKITNSTAGITISPIDQIKQKIEAAGYKVAEVTGRKYELILQKQGGMGRITKEINNGKIIGTIQRRTRENTNDAFRRFNDNEVDVLMINQSGSTGASAHAIPTRKVPAIQVKQRVMIVLQAELDINTEVQKRGRINRTGQILKPIYDYVSCAIPAEKRLMMMLQKKLKSLDANTTSNQKNSESLMKSDDFLNKYGDEVVIGYLKENKKFNTQIGDPFGFNKPKEDGKKQPEYIEDAAHRVTGRVAVLPTKNQEEFYNEIITRYHQYIALLIEQGDYDLEVETQDLKARLIERTILVANGSGTSPFSENTYIEKTEVNQLKKPLSVKELEERINKALDGETAVSKAKNLVATAKQVISARVAELVKESEKDFAEDIKNIREEKVYKSIKDAGARSAYYLQRKGELETARDEDIERIKNRYGNQFDTLKNLFEFFTIGRALNYRLDTENSGTTMAVSLGFKFGNNKKNYFTPSNISLQIAVASSTKQLTIPLSGKSENIAFNIKGASDFYPIPYAKMLDNWTSAIKSSSKDRVVRYIATGNLLQFFGQESVPKSKLIQFTTIDGKVRKGALMPESYMAEGSIGNQINPPKIIVPINKCATIIRNLYMGEVLECSNFLNITKERGYPKFILPTSRDKGGYIYLNQGVLKYVRSNNFFKMSNKMIGYCEPENLQEVLDELGKLKINIELTKEQFSAIESEFSVSQAIQDEVRPVERKTDKSINLKIIQARHKLAQARLRKAF